MFLFDLFKKERSRIPDTTTVCLCRGEFYSDRQVNSSDRVYSLYEWDVDEITDFSALIMDCAKSILEDMPLVINCARVACESDNLRDDPRASEYIEECGQPAYRSNRCFITVSHGIDRALIEKIPYGDGGCEFEFCGYRDLPNYDASVRAEVRLECNLYHTYLRIETLHGIGEYEETIRKVCEKYEKTLVLVGFEQEKNER